jgi:hypothetical protein
MLEAARKFFRRRALIAVDTTYTTVNINRGEDPERAWRELMDMYDPQLTL